MKTGEIIKDLRKRKGVTQTELAEVLGFNRSAIAKIESGEIANLKRETLAILADYFKVSPTYILGYEESYETKEKKNKIIKAFTEEIGTFDYSDQEVAEIISFAKYVLSKRKEQ